MPKDQLIQLSKKDQSLSQRGTSLSEANIVAGIHFNSLFDPNSVLSSKRENQYFSNNKILILV